MDIFDRAPCFDPYHTRTNDVCKTCDRPTPGFIEWEGKYSALKESHADEIKQFVDAAEKVEKADELASTTMLKLACVFVLKSLEAHRKVSGS